MKNHQAKISWVIGSGALALGALLLSGCSSGAFNDGRPGLGSCTAGVCPAGPTCNAQQAFGCGTDDRFCGADQTCDSCPPGRRNCDGLADCECEGASCEVCAAPWSAPGTACGAMDEGICGGEDFFCWGGGCAACANGAKNCDGVLDCETSGECPAREKAPKPCAYDDSDVCGKKKWCSDGTCNACKSGLFNCNRTKGCECDSAGCDGDKCAGECVGDECSPPVLAKPCSYDEIQVCGKKRWCSNGSCNTCKGGLFNCNRTKGCECDSAGCDGDKCAGKCVGDECPPTVCKFGDTGVCGKKNKCKDGQCSLCWGGRFNCNRTKGCECDSAGCDGDKCAGECVGAECLTEPECNYDENSVCGKGAWCWLNECTDCSPGRFNCNGKKGCECDAAGCNKAACAGKCLGGECSPPLVK